MASKKRQKQNNHPELSDGNHSEKLLPNMKLNFIFNEGITNYVVDIVQMKEKFGRKVTLLQMISSSDSDELSTIKQEIEKNYLVAMILGEKVDANSPIKTVIKSLKSRISVLGKVPYIDVLFQENIITCEYFILTESNSFDGDINIPRRVFESVQQLKNAVLGQHGHLAPDFRGVDAIECSFDDEESMFYFEGSSIEVLPIAKKASITIAKTFTYGNFEFSLVESRNKRLEQALIKGEGEFLYAESNKSVKKSSKFRKFINKFLKEEILEKKSGVTFPPLKLRKESVSCKKYLSSLPPANKYFTRIQAFKVYDDVGKKLSQEVFKNIRTLAKIAASQDILNGEAYKHKLILDDTGRHIIDNPNVQVFASTQVKGRGNKEASHTLLTSLPRNSESVHGAKASGTVALVMPSLSGKTQSVFSLGTNVIYIPMLQDQEVSQDIYRNFTSLSDCLFEAADRDMITLSLTKKESYKRKMDKVSSGSISTNFRKKESYLAGLLLSLAIEANKLSNENNDYSWMTRWQDHDSLNIAPITIEYFESEMGRLGLNANDFLVVLDEFLTIQNKNDFGSSSVIGHVFIRNMCRALRFPLIVMGTNSKATNLVGKIVGDSGRRGYAADFIWSIPILEFPHAIDRNTSDSTQIDIKELQKYNCSPEFKWFRYFFQSQLDSQRPGVSEYFKRALKSIQNQNEFDQYIFRVFAEFSTLLRDRKTCLNSVKSGYGQVDLLLQERFDNDLRCYEATYADSHFYCIDLPLYFFYFDIVESVEELMHFCLFVRKKKFSVLPTDELQQEHESWKPLCRPIFFQAETLLHIGCWGNAGASLLKNCGIMDAFIRLHKKENPKTLFAKKSTGISAINDGSIAEIIIKATAIDSSHKKINSFLPLSLKSYLEYCIRNFHQDYNNGDKISWPKAIEDDRRSVINTVKVPYLGKDNSKWPSYTDELGNRIVAPNWFGVARGTTFKERLDFIAQAIDSKSQSCKISFEAKTRKENLGFEDIVEIAEKCINLRRKRSVNSEATSEENEQENIENALVKIEGSTKCIVIFCLNASSRNICKFSHPRISCHMVYDRKYTRGGKRKVLPSLVSANDRFVIVPFEELRAAYDTAAEDASDKITVEGEDTIMLLVIPGMFPTIPVVGRTINDEVQNVIRKRETCRTWTYFPYVKEKNIVPIRNKDDEESDVDIDINSDFYEKK